MDMLRKAIIGLIIMTVPAAAQAARLTDEQVTEMLKNNIRVVQHMALNPLLVKAVRQQNARVLDAAELEARARAWRSSGAEDPLRRDMQSGDHATVMRRFVESNPGLSGALLTDARGAGVAAWPLPDNYWQGDAPAWAESYNGGEGRIFVGALQLDEKTGTVSASVSAPVVDRNETIGVLVVAVNLGGSR
jgi:hypothetical protein